MRDDVAFTIPELHAFLAFIADIPAILVSDNPELSSFIVKVAKGHDRACDGTKMEAQIQESFKIADKEREFLVKRQQEFEERQSKAKHN